jgi:hypothetical protein
VLSTTQAPPVRRWWLWGLGGISGLLLFIFLLVKNGCGNPPTTQALPQNQQPQNSEFPTETVPEQQQVPIATDTPEKPIQAPSTPKTYNEKLLALAEASFGTPSVLADNNIRSGTGAATDPLQTWREMLRQPKPDFKKVIAGLSKIKQDDEADALLAYAYFKEKQFDKAAAIYQRLSESKKITPAQKDEAEWHLLMNLLPDSSKRKDVDELLAKMLNPDNFHEYQHEANELRTKLPND